VVGPTSSLLQALSVVLEQRGYVLLRVAADDESALADEVFRLRFAGNEKPIAVLSATARPTFELEVLAELVREIAEVVPRAIEREPSRRTRTTMSRPTANRLLGQSPAMQKLYAIIERLASSDSTSVLIQGENGTGKELVAHAIHQSSPRRDRTFVATNCSAFNDNLLDSELFGHTRGAFTGASVDKAGLFEAADQGTFFLDEIGDMSPALQAKVLRVLQDGTFHRVGDHEPRTVNVRIIAATNRDLAAMVKSGNFREDLYYRINVVNIVVPPLRDRRIDIPILIEAFLNSHSGQGTKTLSPACAARMLEYSWPGNVRELENEVERLVVLAGDAPSIETDMLTPRIRDAVADRPAPSNPESLPEAIAALEREMIAAALHKHRGNKSRAAQALQVSRRNLIRLVHKYQLDTMASSDP
jgi:two-component system, NtrC family, response regulator HupR/HoxA